MEKRRVIGFAIFALALACGLGWFISRSREPEYDGKPLSYWLRAYGPYDRTETFVQAADHAFESMGTNAIPFLLQRLEKGDSPFRDKLIETAKKQHWVKVRWETSNERMNEVCDAFGVLNTYARYTVPALISIYQKNIGNTSRVGVLVSLAAIGPPAKDSVPMLTNFLAESPIGLRGSVVYAIGGIHAHPEQAIPALMAIGSNSPPNDQRIIAWAFGNFGTNAKPALPLLNQWRTNGDRGLANFSRNAIEKIEQDSSASR